MMIMMMIIIIMLVFMEGLLLLYLILSLFSYSRPKVFEKLLRMIFLNKLAYWLTIKPRLLSLKKLLPEARIHPAGSRYVCNPPSMFTDVDFLVYTENGVDDVLIARGYVKTEFKEYANMFSSDGKNVFQPWRKGKINLVVTSSIQYAESFHTAAAICKTNNVLDKLDRVIIHEIIRGGITDPDLSCILLNDELTKLLFKFFGPNRHAVHKAYRAKHGLEL